jgi:hypothetical protein
LIPTILKGGCVIAEAELTGGNIVVVRIGFGLIDWVGEGFDGVGEGFAIFLPVLHMSFFPDFIQVKIIPADFEVTPALGQTVPGITFAIAEVAGIAKANIRDSKIANWRFIH